MTNNTINLNNQSYGLGKDISTGGLTKNIKNNFLKSNDDLSVSKFATQFKDILESSEKKTEKAIENDVPLYDVVTTISKAEVQLKLLITIRDATINAWNELIKMNI